MSHTYQLPIQAIKPDYLSKILQQTKWFNECDFCLKHPGYTFELSIKNKNASNNTIKKYEMTKPFKPSIKFVPLTKIIKQKEVNKQLMIKLCK